MTPNKRKLGIDHGMNSIMYVPNRILAFLHHFKIPVNAMTVPRVLLVAGSDSSGGAGLEADQRVLACHGVYAMTATTALTAQNTLGVEDVHVIPPSFVRKQVKQVLDDVGCDVVKLGTYEVRKA